MHAPSPTALIGDHAGVYRKISWRILPLLMLCYLFAYLDRVNISFAKLQMQADIGLGDAAFGLGAGIFFLGYMVFEIPSNLLLPRIGARKTLSRIMVLWGLTSAAMMFTRDVTMFYVLRFLLGVFEAGFAPGMVYYLTLWYPQARLARVMAIVMAAAPISGIVGAPLSTWLMTSLAGAHGLAGWQWMFLIEGVPCALLGIVVYCCLADNVASAKWLDASEKAMVSAELGSRRGKHHGFRQVSADPRIYVMALGYFCVICGIYAISFWLPTILKASGVADLMTLGFYSAVPYLVAVVAMYVVARRSDARGERRWHSAIPALLGAVALAVSALSIGNLYVSLISITLATALIWTAYTVFWAMPSEYLKGEAAAGGIALINSIGLIGGFLSPTLIGWVKGATGSLSLSLAPMVVLLVCGAAALLANKPGRAAATV
ncbi:MFS transporter [Cupriavidus pampae]|uniref:Tartrate transporter n=1 Tax=Cupriavidus pampae TaxID=659251 RepID=A0ABM8X144_9BURK|nr:MFS transporter [Cupriavidus pampae]CAG9173595.1 Putative tartrate transporter [Cupriavidus pampae]